MAIARILLALLADAVFTSAASKERAAASEVRRYFEQRRLPRPRAPRTVTSR